MLREMGLVLMLIVLDLFDDPFYFIPALLATIAVALPRSDT